MADRADRLPRLTPRLVGIEARRRMLHNVALSIIGLVVVAGAALAVSRSSLFALQHVRVTGTRHLSVGRVEQLAGLTRSSNVIWMSTASIRRRLAEDPWVASVRVSRTLPSSLSISIRERSAVAVAARPGGPDMLIAADGTVLGLAIPGDRLPLVQLPGSLTLKSGSRVPATSPALRAAAAFPPAAAGRIASVTLGREGIELHTRDGIRVVYGDASAAAAKGEAIEAVLVWLEQHHIQPLYIDVSAPTAPAVMPASQQVIAVAGGGTVTVGPGVQAPTTGTQTDHGSTSPAPSSTSTPPAG